MLDALRPRGPDAERTVLWSSRFQPITCWAPNGLLHTRLSIIDPRHEADQPMVNAAGDIWINYNGEVYDWASDAEILKAAGFHFRTHCDTEFILHAYEHWGIGFLERLRGMFAIAICDQRRKVVYLVRDRLGLKPVVYAHRDDGFAFASTVRALLPWLPIGARALSPEGIDAYLTHRGIPAPRTLFKEILRLPAAHFARYDLQTGNLLTQEYWRPKPSQEPWLATLDAAIRMRTVADRPLGLYLSSGVDSTTLACRLSLMGFSGLQSFTAAFPGTAYDESQDAHATAQKLGFANRTFTLPLTIGADFPQIVADLDEPFADPSSIPTWYLGRETTRHVKVVLGGDGGDELLGGYKRYAKHLRTRWRHNVTLPWLKAPSLNGSHAWQRIAEELRLDWRSAYVLRFSGLTPRERAYLQPDVCPSPHYWRLPVDPDGADLETLLEIDRLNYLPEYIMRKEDLCTMAHGLELRAPFLDHRFVASIIGLPAALRFTKPPKKLLAPAVAAVGDSDLFSAKKRGFNPPLSGWLRADLASRIPGLGKRLADLTSEQVSAARVNDLTIKWRNNGRRFDEQLLQLIMLDESLTQLSKLTAVA
jgi:asparagine synthase (glutamine-hydrolysing)